MTAQEQSSSLPATGWDSAEKNIPAAHAATPAARAKPKASRVLVGLAALAMVAAGGHLLLSRGRETTDDAFVEGHVANVCARIQAQVVEVLVKDNQLVEVGAPLVRLDGRDIEARLKSALADLDAAKAAHRLAEAHLVLAEKNSAASLHQARGGVAQARSAVASSAAHIRQAEATAASARSRLDLANLEWERASELRGQGAVAQSVLDDRSAQRRQAEAAMAEAEAHLVSARAEIEGASGGVESAHGKLLGAEAGPDQVEAARAQVLVAHAHVEQSEAAVAQAKLNLSYTTVTSTIRGVVSRKTVEPGQMVDPSRPLMSITALDDLWIVANYKEDQITHMRAGQPVSIVVDAFPGEKLQGHVDSLAGATGARFSLLPPDNASGNFTKVVQRVPVLVRVDSVPPNAILRPGLSTTVSVNVR